MTRTAKQVIVMRNDLNMRKGKMIAQGAHASLGVVYLIEDQIRANRDLREGGYEAFPISCLEAYETWKYGTFAKICVYVNSAEELHELQTLAEIANLPSKLIIDAGLTEFNGVPTETCLAIGPAWSDEIDEITGKLPLL